MVKKYLFIGLLCSVSLLHNVAVAADRAGERRLRAAISALNLEEVQKLLKRDGLITPENKKEFANDARDLMEYYEEESSLLRSPKDALSAFAGAGLGAASLFFLYKGGSAVSSFSSGRGRSPSRNTASYNGGTTTSQSSVQGIGSLAAGGVAGALAVYLAKKGFLKENRAYCLDRATEIVQLLENA